ncbi:hypothetical protein [Parasphingorhabdus pacifica]
MKRAAPDDIDADDTRLVLGVLPPDRSPLPCARDCVRRFVADAGRGG